MRYLFVLNDPPCGSERCDNALRHARALLERGHGALEVRPRMFLLADAVVCARAGQDVTRPCVACRAGYPVEAP